MGQAAPGIDLATISRFLMTRKRARGADMSGALPPPPPPRAIPLSHYPMINTQDTDEARLVASRLYGAMQLDCMPGHTSVPWQCNRAAFGAISVAAGWLPHGGIISAESHHDRYIFNLALDGTSQARAAGEEFDVVSGGAGLLLAPDRHAKLHMPERFSSLTLAIARAPLEEHFCKLVQAPLRAPLRCAARVDLTTEPGAGLLRLIDFLVSELDRPAGPIAAPLIRASLTDALLTALLSSALREQTTVAPPLLVRPGYLRRAEDYMEVHAADPITIPDVAAAAGVSIRALQNAFRRYRDCSPLYFLQERRLDLARCWLLAATPETTITEVALAAGYSHASHFGVNYRRRFAETPSQTLRRSRRG